jgi:hypothetical protein
LPFPPGDGDPELGPPSARAHADDPEHP